MTAADTLISKLDKVKRTGKDRYSACCPAHDDKGPSLSIRETDDGRVLVHCFAGCSVHEIVQAVGLELSDLFPPRLAGDHARPERRPFPATDALRAVSFEAIVVCAAAAALATGEPLSAVDRERLLQAGERIQSALSGAGL
ncbi:MAG TPA: CHC2 zinc finger domain-containing protein [Azonexus sp.]|nr:CHC2 zinc finger domain-containing protein [Azonexus sp.]